MRAPRNLKSLGLEILGWLLVAFGIAALVLPGPGLLALFAGLALLSTRYSWAERRLEPVQRAALKAAADSVASWPRIAISVIGVLALIAVGIVWGIHPSEPSWWPLTHKLWLPGGWGTGGSIIGSGIIAAAMIIYSFVNFREHKKTS